MPINGKSASKKMASLQKKAAAHNDNNNNKNKIKLISKWEKNFSFSPI